MTEIIDIYDANLQHIGEMERLKAHMDGHWHKTFHLWIVNNVEKSLILQLRSPQAKNYPNLLDITAAGHLMKGEALQDGIREVTEELGIPISNERVFSLGYRIEVADQDNGQKNREYQGVHLLVDSRPLNAYRPDPKEVYGLVSLPIEAGQSLFCGSTSSITVSAFRFDASTESWKLGDEQLTKDKFLPRIQNYYLTMLIMAERVCEGRSILAIS